MASTRARLRRRTRPVAGTFAWSGSFTGKSDEFVLHATVDRLRLLEAEYRAAGRVAGKRVWVALVLGVFFVVGIVSYASMCQPHAAAFFALANGTSTCMPARTDGYTILDGIYLSVQIVMTVGLGDLYPAAPAATNWTTGFSFVGLAVLAYSLSGVLNTDRQKGTSVRQRRIHLLETYGASAKAKISEIEKSRRAIAMENTAGVDDDRYAADGSARSVGSALENEADGSPRGLFHPMSMSLMLDAGLQAPAHHQSPLSSARQLAPPKLQHSVESAMLLVHERSAECRKLGLGIAVLVIIHCGIMAAWAFVFQIYVGWSFAASLFFVWTVATTVGYGDYATYECVIERTHGYACRTPDKDSIAQILVLLYIVTALSLSATIFRYATDLVNEVAALAAATLHVAEAFAIRRIHNARRALAAHSKVLTSIESQFAAIDLDGSGSIGIEELRAILPSAMGAAEASALLEEFDADGSGALELEELRTMIKTLEVRANGLRETEDGIVQSARDMDTADKHKRCNVCIRSMLGLSVALDLVHDQEGDPDGAHRVPSAAGGASGTRRSSVGTRSQSMREDASIASFFTSPRVMRAVTTIASGPRTSTRSASGSPRRSTVHTALEYTSPPQQAASHADLWANREQGVDVKAQRSAIIAAGGAAKDAAEGSATTSPAVGEAGTADAPAAPPAPLITSAPHDPAFTSTPDGPADGEAEAEGEDAAGAARSSGGEIEMAANSVPRVSTVRDSVAMNASCLSPMHPGGAIDLSTAAASSSLTTRCVKAKIWLRQNYTAGSPLRVWAFRHGVPVIIYIVFVLASALMWTLVGTYRKGNAHGASLAHCSRADSTCCFRFVVPSRVPRPPRVALIMLFPSIACMLCVAIADPLNAGSHAVGDKWSFLDALYFVCITVTTVGFGDFSPADDAGRIVCIVWGTAGLIVTTAAVRQVNEVFIDVLSPPCKFLHAKLVALRRRLMKRTEAEQKRRKCVVLPDTPRTNLLICCVLFALWLVTWALGGVVLKLLDDSTPRQYYLMVSCLAASLLSASDLPMSHPTVPTSRPSLSRACPSSGRRCSQRALVSETMPRGPTAIKFSSRSSRCGVFRCWLRSCASLSTR